MKSKISFFKLMKSEAKYKSWLVALISLTLFLALPVTCLLRVDGLVRGINGSYRNLAAARDVFESFIGFGNIVRMMITIVSAVVCGFTFFNYMNHKSKVDFYHSLPVRRQTLFMAEFLNGFLFYAVPYLVCTIICVIIGAANSLVTGGCLLAAFQAFLMQMLYFMVVYVAVILSAVLTGKLIVGLLAAMTFMFYGPLLIVVTTGLAQVFFKTLMSMGGDVLDEVIACISPLLLCIKAEGKMVNGGPALFEIVCLILFAVLIFLASIWLYCKRNSEAAGHSVAFPKIERPLKFLLVVPGSLAVGLLLKIMSYSGVWFFAGILFGAIIISAVIEFIYHLDIREIFSHKILLGATVVTSVLIACSFYFDWMGYDSYLPAKEDLDSIAVYTYEMNGNYYYGDINGSEDGQRMRALDALETTKFDSAYELAKEAVNGEMNDMDYYEDREVCSISVKYKLRSGKEVYRNYNVDRKKLDLAMAEMFKDPSYVERFFPMLGREDSQIKYMDLNVNGAYYNLELTAKQKNELLTAYRAELLTVSYDTLINEYAVATLGINLERRPQMVKTDDSGIIYMEEGQISDGTYPIYPSFTNTVRLLNEFGYPVGKSLDAADISFIRVIDYNCVYAKSYEVPIECTFTEKADIEQIVPALVGVNTFSGGPDGFVGIDVTVTTKDGNVLMMGFVNGNVPECVKNALENYR